MSVSFILVKRVIQNLLIYLYFYTWCNNLIPGMSLWKQNLLTCALTAAVAFKILYLWSYALYHDDGATASSSLENRVPEYLTVMFSRCVGCQKGQQIFVPSGHFLILEEQKSQAAVRWIRWKVQFCKGLLSQEPANS